MHVTAYLGLGSRYSYLASTQLADLEAETGAMFDWVPIDSVTLIRLSRRHGSPFDDPVGEGQYDFTYRDLDAKRWAGFYGVPFQAPDLSALATDTMALACWSMPDRASRKVCVERLFAAVFVQGEQLSPETVDRIASEVSDTRLHERTAISAHEDALETALASGVFGVPSFVVDGDMFWGNDRLLLLRHRLAELSAL